MTTDTLCALVVTEIGELTGTLEERCRAAFDVAVDHWMVTDPNQQILAALAAVLVSYELGEEERTRLEFSMKFAQSINAAASGIPVDMGRLADEGEGLDPVPYQKWWKECGGRI